MASLNKVQIIGNLGRDPEARTFPSGDMVCNITVATTEKWKDKQTGEQKEHTEWVRIVFNGKLAEIANQYLRKGSQVYVEGSLRTRKWTDQSGVEKYSTEIRADQMQMLGPRQDGGGRGGDGGGYDDGYGGGQQRQQQRQAPQGQQQRQAPQGGRGNDGYGAPQQRQQGGQQYQQGQQQNRGGGGGSGFDDFGDQDIPF